VISGVPGAGKSSVAGLVADSLPRSAVPDADALARMVRSGWVGPIGEPADEARAQLRLRTRNVCLLAGSFAEAGFFPVIDHVVADREMLEAMLGWLQPRPVWFVTLAPDLSTARARNATRPERERIDYDISGLYADIQRELSTRAGGSTPQRSAPRTRPRGSSLRPAREQSSRGLARVPPHRSRPDTNWVADVFLEGATDLTVATAGPAQRVPQTISGIGQGLD